MTGVILQSFLIIIRKRKKMSERRDRMRRIRREQRRQNRLNRNKKKILKSLLGWCVLILGAVVIGYIIVGFMFQTVYMVGSSMKPTIANEEKVIVNKWIYNIKSPERYDIVAYRLMDENNEYYDIKRIVGLPGETVTIYDGQVLIDGEPLKDSPVTTYIFTKGMAESGVTLGDNEYFLLGDNVNNSEDSRYVSVGKVRKNELLGRINR